MNFIKDQTGILFILRKIQITHPMPSRKYLKEMFLSNMLMFRSGKSVSVGTPFFLVISDSVAFSNCSLLLMSAKLSYKVNVLSGFLSLTRSYFLIFTYPLIPWNIQNFLKYRAPDFQINKFSGSTCQPNKMNEVVIRF